jgi:hypothetical protein
MPERDIADFVLALEERGPRPLDHQRVERRSHTACQRTRVLVAPDRHAAQRPLVLGVVIKLLVVAAILHQKLRSLRVACLLGLTAQVVDLGVQRGGHLPAHKPRRGVERPQPGRKACL